MPPIHLALSAERRTCVCCALSVLALLFGLGYAGLFISLSEDDLMNLHFGMHEPLARLFVANLFPFTTVFRPAGAAIYVALFKTFGFSPIYYRVVLYGILLLSCVALYRLVKELDGRVTAAAMAPLFIAFHSRFMHIYAENSYVYDPLCGLLFVVTVLFYHHRRRRGIFRSRDVLILYLLWAATVNAKEVGLTLPVVLLTYEVVFAKPLTFRSLLWPCVLLGLSFAAWRGKVAEGSPLHGHPHYQPTVHPLALFDEARRQVAEAILSPTFIARPAVFAAVVILIVALVCASRSKTAYFGLLWAVITPLPVLAIGGRPLSSLFVVGIGVAILLGAVLAEAFDRLRLRDNTKTFAVLGVCLFWALLQWNDMGQRPSVRESGAQWEHVRDAIGDYSRLPGLCEAHMLLVLDSRFGTDRYHPLFIAQLLCGDYGKVVHIAGLNISEDDAVAKRPDYDLVLRDLGDNLEVVQRR